MQGQIARAMADAVRQGLGGAEWSPRHFVENEPFRTLWSHIDELGLVACVHPSLGITGPDAISSGAFAERVSQRLGVAHTVAEPIAHMQDADLFVTTAFFHGLLEDFPSLRLAILHAGTSWVPLALEKSETYLWLSPQFARRSCASSRRRSGTVTRSSCRSTAGRSRSRSCPTASATRRRGGRATPTTTRPGPTRRARCSRPNDVDAAMIDRLMGGNAADLFRLQVPATT